MVIKITSPQRKTQAAEGVTSAETPDFDPKDIMATSATKAPAPGSVTMFTTSWCGYCNRLKAQMGREGIPFTEVNIEDEPDAVQFVMEVNGGNQTVPTLLFPDGSAATNPSLNEVKKRLAA
jgi:mycoredoxin